VFHDDDDDEDDFDPELFLQTEVEPLPDLGPCCCCGVTDHVRTIVMMSRRAPVPGTGWGCFACHLPLDGAVYVACDRCAEEGRPPFEVCHGSVNGKARARVESLAPGPFDHDPAYHWELRR
jgi:hypothetical protein